MDYTTYLDKCPLTGYSLGPSGSGVVNPQPFTTNWIGWIRPDQGIYYQKLAAFGGNPVYFLKETGFANASAFSFTFDSGNALYYAIEQNNSISVVNFSGATKITRVFNGQSPQLYNNSILQRSGNETSCFYVKNDNQIYFRNASEGFSSEYIAYSGNKSIVGLKAIIKDPFTGLFYRYGIFALDSDANGHMLVSNRYPTFQSSYFQPFDSISTGIIYTLPLWDIEEPTTVILKGYNIWADSLENYPTGILPSQFKFSGISYVQTDYFYSLSGGYIING